MRNSTQADFTTHKVAYSYAVSLLSRREYSRQALHTRLIEKGAPFDIVIQVLDELRDSGYQNDERFIQSLVRVRVSQGKGPLVLYQEAKEHHIPLVMLQSAIQAESLDWYHLAIQALEKRFEGVPQNIKEKAKQYRFLMMRGFERDQINAALK